MQKEWWQHFPEERGGVVTKPADPTLPYKTTQEQYQAQAAPYVAERARNQAAASGYDPARAAADLEKARIDADKARLDIEKAKTEAARGPQFNEYQSKSTAFLRRALGANIDFESLDIGPRSYVGEALHDNAPNLLNQLPSAIGNSPSRQRADSTQDEFIAATLRQDSGAAIPPEEMIRQRQIYFPQPGETDPAIIAQKREARRRAIQGLMDSGGPAVPDDIRTKAQDWLKSFDVNGKPTSDEESGLRAENDAWAAARGVTVDRGPSGPPQSPLAQLGSDFLNVGAGLGQGIAGLPDMFAKGAGQIMAAPVDLMGFDNVANQLRNPLQIGEQIEKYAPTPQDWNGWGLRQVSKLTGGGIGLPQGMAKYMAEELGGSSGIPSFFNPKNVPVTPPSQIYSDAKSLGIQPTVEAVGGPTSRTMNSLLAKSLAGANAVKQGAQRMVTQGGTALSNIAGRQGQTLNREALGETAISGANAYRQTSRDAIGKLYDRAAKASEGVSVKPEGTLSALDQNIAELSRVPGGGDGVAYLTKLRDEIAQNFPDGITVDGFRGMRTALRDKFIKDGLRGTDLERRVGGIIEAASNDISASLAAQGKTGAANLFKRADAAWAERVGTIDKVIAPFLGRNGEKTGEQVAAALTSSTRGAGDRFAAFVKTLPEEDAGNVRASLIEGLGKAKAGAQDAEGSVFSFNELLTNWNKLSEPAKRALFDGTDKSAMDRLVRVAAEVKDASRYANTSNSGGVFINGLTLFTGVTDATSGGMVAAGSYALAKALSNPGVAKLMSIIGSAKTPQQVRAAAGQLSNLARKYPGAAQELTQMRDSILKAANENARQTVPAAASDSRQKQNY